MAGRFVSRVLTRSNLAISLKSASSSRVTTGLDSVTTAQAQICPTIYVRGLGSDDSPFGFDFKHWFIKIKELEGDLTRDEIIDIYIKMLASVVGSEEEARMNLYSVSTRFCFGFGALISEELPSKFKEHPIVVMVFSYCCTNSFTKDYGARKRLE